MPSQSDEKTQNSSNLKKKLNKFYLKINKIVFVRSILIFLVSIFIILFILFSPFLLFYLGAMFFPVHYSNLDIPLYSYIDKEQEIKGEPINLIIIGIDIEQEKTFESLGWQELQNISKEKLTEIIKNLGQETTPISNRYLFNQVQDLAYQGKESTIFHRHHIRLWKVINNDLPIYYATASYDKSVGIAPLDLFFKPTHLIAPNIDTERDMIGNILAKELGANLYYFDGILPSFYLSNNDNSWYYTDGELSIITKDNFNQNNSTQRWLSLRRSYSGLITAFLRILQIAE